MQRVAALADLEEGVLGRYELGSLRLLAGLVEGKPIVLQNLCTHAYVSFGEGKLRGCKLTCPWHGLTFDVVSGECDDWPGLEKLRRYDVMEQDGDVYIEESRFR